MRYYDSIEYADFVGELCETIYLSKEVDLFPIPSVCFEKTFLDFLFWLFREKRTLRDSSLEVLVYEYVSLQEENWVENILNPILNEVAKL